MSSTYKTTHYELSQYVGSDKPTYLSDYNGDMLKIDTAINTAKTTADSAFTAATNAATVAETAQTTANTAVTNAATAQNGVNTNATNIGSLANLTTTDKTSLVNSVNEVNAGMLANNSAITLLSANVEQNSSDISTINGKITPVVIYTRDEPTAFEPYTLTIDLTSYSYIEIQFARYTGGNETITERFDLGVTSQAFYCDYDNGVRSWDRPITVNSSSIVIGNCTINGVIDNNGLKPKQITAYK